MNIVLIGFMGTGKSVVGRALSQRLDLPVLDTDVEIERRWDMPVPRIFAEHGEAAFRTAETEFLASLCPPRPRRERVPPPGSRDASGHPRQGFILSTGGGTPLRPENAALLKRIGPVIWLIATPDAILSRVGWSLHQRPLLAAHAHDPRARIQQLLSERCPQYAALADVCINTAAYDSPDAVAGRITVCLKNL